MFTYLGNKRSPELAPQVQQGQLGAIVLTMMPDYVSFLEEYAFFLKERLKMYRKETYKNAAGRHNRPLKCARAPNALGEE
jgi:hypothetical protein